MTGQETSTRLITAELRTRSFAITVLLAAALALVLNATDIWPFAWRWQYDSNVGLVQALLTSAHTAALVYWLLLYSVGVPILEEVVFRFGLLRTVEHLTGSAPAAGVRGSRLRNASPRVSAMETRRRPHVERDSGCVIRARACRSGHQAARADFAGDRSTRDAECRVTGDASCCRSSIEKARSARHPEPESAPLTDRALDTQIAA